MMNKISKKLILVMIGILMFIPTVVFAETEVVNPTSFEYLKGSNNLLSYTFDADKSVSKVSVDNEELGNSNYVVSNNSLSFATEYLETLSLGNHDVVIEFVDGEDNDNTNIMIAVLNGDSLEESDTVVSDNTGDNELVNAIPDYYFVSVPEKNNSKDTIKEEVYSSVIDSLSDNEVEVNSYSVDVEVGYPEDIFAVDVTITDVCDDTNSVSKNGTIVYSNADNYVESDHNLVNEFVSNHNFVYTNSYELVDDFENHEYSIDEVYAYVDEMFDNTSIEYEFNEISDLEDSNIIGNVLMYVNSKYYASSYFYYKNVAYVYVPFFVDDVNSYVASRAYEILVNKYNIAGHSLSYRDGHLYDDVTGYDFGELDYVIDDSYNFSYVSGDTSYEKLSNTDMEIIFDQELGNAVSLKLDDIEVDNGSYNVSGKSLVINYNYLNSLKNNNYDLVLNTDRGNASTSITIIPKQYKYIDGADSVFDKGVKKTLTVRINADVNKFVNVYLNNNVLSTDVYTIREGSTIIDISFDYLKELTNGVYKLKTIFTDGEAVTNLNISGKKKEYKITGVSNQTYEKKSNNNVVFNLNTISSVVNFDVNGVSIGKSNYYVSGNSVVVKGDYLNNLNNNKYNVSIIFDDGSVNSYLYVKEKSSQSSTVSTGSSTSSSGSYYVPKKPYYRPSYVYTYDNDDNVNVNESSDLVVEEVKTEETKTDDSNILEVVPEKEKDTIKKETKKEVKKETKKKTEKKTTTKKKSTKKLTEKKKDSSKKGLFSIFKKKDNTTENSKTEEKKKDSSKKGLFGIFKKKDNTDDNSNKEEKKLSEKKDDSSNKRLFNIFKKKSDKKDNEKENNSSNNTAKKKLSSNTKNNKDNDSGDDNAMLLTVDKIVNSRIFIASLIVLICGLSCYILYMVTKRDEEE